MINKICCFLILLISNSIFSQELNCRVEVIADKVPQTNKQIFVTLKSAMTDFMNNTQFTSTSYSREERIECNFVFVVQKYEDNVITGTLQVLSSRPVYNSTYSTPVLNFKDNQVSFKYIEFEPLTYSENSFSGDLVGVMSFYANLIIGLDNDTFSKLSGTNSLQKANNFVNMAQQSGGIGWKQSEKSINRYFLITDILSNSFVAYREAMYDYHMKGMDVMMNNPIDAKNAISAAISKFENVNSYRPNALPTRVFFDTKTDEIISVFSGGPEFKKQPLIDVLNKVYPLFSGKWNKI